MITFLEVNGIPTEATNEEIVGARLALAKGKMKYNELLRRIREH